MYYLNADSDALYSVRMPIISWLWLMQHILCIHFH